MRFSIDSWDPAYGTSLQEASEELADAQVRMDLTVEVEPDAWRPVAPDGSTPPDVILFVDGVRRTEAHVWTHSDDPFQAAPGMCASYAAGVVRSSGGNAEVVSAEVRRGLFTVDPAAESISTSAGVWQVNHSAPGANPPGQLFVQALQRKLTELEVVCAASARSHLPAEDDLLLIDGPLRNRTELPRTLAFIKTQQAKYLPPELNRVVGELAPGERTPVFLLGTEWDRHTWYMRLPGGSGSPWAGVIRVECSPALDALDAVALAYVSQATLPRYASEAFREMRAPQNLYPVAGLERHLRHRLGDPRLLRRILQAAAGGAA